MASASCTNFGYRYYNGGWSEKRGSSKLYGGYAGSSSYVVRFYFTTPSVSGLYTGTKLKITIPFVKQTQSATSGTLYARLTKYVEADEPALYSKSIGTIPNADNCDGSGSWSASDREVHTATITINKSVSPNTAYYITIGCNINYLEIGHAYDNATSMYAASLEYTSYTNGSVAKPTIKDNGNNTFTLSGSYTNGTNNKLSSGKIYYTTNGKDPSTSSSSVTLSSTGTTLNVPSGASSSTVKAFAYGTFAHNNDSSSVATKTVYYYTNGSSPTVSVKDNGNNTFTVSGKLGSNGWNNGLSSATLYYTTNGKAPDSGQSWTTSVSLTSTGSGGSYSKTYNIPSGCTKVYAIVYCSFARNTTNSGNAIAAVKYYTAIGKPAISITDNYDNTFTISGTKASNGTNNTATTSYAWGYSTSYGNSGTGAKSLTIATPGNATRTVYAKATASPSWSGDSAKTATTSLDIKQYVAPSAPGTPVIAYSKSRLTIKENWTFTWTAATKTNRSSPIKGYRIRLYKNGSLVTGITGSTSSDTIKKGSGSNEYLDRESTSCTVTFDPTAFGFVPGDTVQLGIYSYTRNGSSNTGAQLFNGGGDGSAHVKSAVSTVRNAGIVRVKPNGSWVEGQVYVKVDGSWREAETVSTKVSGNWKESE